MARWMKGSVSRIDIQQMYNCLFFCLFGESKVKSILQRKSISFWWQAVQLRSYLLTIIHHRQFYQQQDDEFHHHHHLK